MTALAPASAPARTGTPRRRIAILGNMNNTGFALMRYFRDLGEDAHLLLYANDGTNSLSHFVPEADSWDIDRWRPFIHQTRLFNWTTSLVPDFREFTWPMSPARIREQLAGFDLYLGSGAAPAIFARAGLRLDAYYPYSLGVEWLDSPTLLAAIRHSWVNRWSLRRIRSLQRAGIRAARLCFNAEMGPTARALEAIGVRFERLPFPAVYDGEEIDAARAETRALALAGGRSAAFRILCASRIRYINKANASPEDWRTENKHSDLIFHGLRALRDRKPDLDAKLYVVEYGPDCEEAKALCRRLGIEADVVWLPQMERRDIACVMRWCDVALGEFYENDGTIWGFTGWEALAAGTPFIQRVNFAPGEYEAAFGHPRPPLIDARTADALADNLLALAEDEDRRRSLGRLGRSWFERHNGRALARRWLDLLTRPTSR